MINVKIYMKEYQSNTNTYILVFDAVRKGQRFILTNILLKGQYLAAYVLEKVMLRTKEGYTYPPMVTNFYYFL